MRAERRRVEVQKRIEVGKRVVSPNKVVAEERTVADLTPGMHFDWRRQGSQTSTELARASLRAAEKEMVAETAAAKRKKEQHSGSTGLRRDSVTRLLVVGAGTDCSRRLVTAEP